VIVFGDESNVGGIDTGEINAIAKEISEQSHKVIFINGPAGSYELSIESIEPRGMIS